MKKKVVLFASILSCAMASTHANAVCADVSGAVDILSQHIVRPHRMVPNDTPVVQASGRCTHETGLFVDVWGSAGVEKSGGNEIDYVLGYNIPGRNTSLYAGYYDLVGDEIWTAGVSYTRAPWFAEVQYLKPSFGDAGYLFDLSYTYKNFTQKFVYTPDFLNRRSLVSVTQYAHPLSDTFSMSASVYKPLIHRDVDGGDMDTKPEIRLGIHWRF